MFRGLKTLWEKQNRSFEKDANIHWASLSRITNLLIIMNITLFFLTELVTKQGYYYTFYSIFFSVLGTYWYIVATGFIKTAVVLFDLSYPRGCWNIFSRGKHLVLDNHKSMKSICAKTNIYANDLLPQNG